VAAQVGLTVILFLAYELAYWVDHYLSHAAPFLWEFHRVHHTAETLTPLTVFRVHPIDTLVFFNITALIMGGVHGAAVWVLGWPANEATLFGSNVILLTFVFLTVHLQHSHVWIAFTGVWGRIFASPAHHQIHHSTNPAHFGKNLGSCLALWDWVFGTLRVPTAAREPLVYGVEPGEESPHTITGGLITPFARAFAVLATWAPRAFGLAAPTPSGLAEPSLGSNRQAS
jgi:sterol desaturase/sphingolipid hydroxylase (fatty acid hydroxylase superfamily)